MPTNASGTMLLPEGASVSFLDKNSIDALGPLLQDTKLHHTTSSLSENIKFSFFQKGISNWILTFVDKGDEQNISALDPLPDTSTKYIAIPNNFLTVPPTYKTLESDAVSLQDSL